MMSIILLIANYTLPTNVTDIGGFLGWANTAVNNLFGIGILMALFLIVLVGSILKGWDAELALTGAGVICMLGGLLELLMKPPLVSSFVPVVFAGVTLLGVVLLLMRGGANIY